MGKRIVVQAVAQGRSLPAWGFGRKARQRTTPPLVLLHGFGGVCDRAVGCTGTALYFTILSGTVLIYCYCYWAADGAWLL